MIGGRIQRLQRPIISRGLRARYFAGPESGNDASGNGVDGTEAGSVAWEDGSFNRAAFFDASGDNAFINVGSVDDFAFFHNTGVFSISFRLKCYGDARGALLISSGSSSDKGIFLAQEVGYASTFGDHAMRCIMFRGAYPTYLVSAVTDNDVLHIGDDDRWCVVFNKPVASVGQWYRNGVAINTRLNTDGAPTGAVVSGPAARSATLGKYSAESTSMPANGALEDFRVYDVNLTPEEAIAITTGRA